MVGPRGSGKTRVAALAAELANFRVLEVDASQEDLTPAELKARYEEATASRRLAGSRTLVLVDDVDAGLLDADRRFAGALRALVRGSKCPVVCTGVETD